MTFTLKDNKDKKIFELKVELNNTNGINVKHNINITNYSKFLIKNIEKSNNIIDDFNHLNEIDGWLWDRFFLNLNPKSKNTEDIIIIIDKIKVILNKIVKEYKIKLDVNETNI